MVSTTVHNLSRKLHTLVRFLLLVRNGVKRQVTDSWPSSANEPCVCECVGTWVCECETFRHAFSSYQASLARGWHGLCK